ncbi:glycosyltransferase family 4 protein [Leptospira idonii]|uniref:Glycosyltransferase family 1 protein n=1 Tax=Leptospira idonii TaxID=1193500 RepID=A0A4R9LXC3_9LEPT|nr:glycosyltransferase family 4 protein [Leptospira idonii]TGN18312.1 glycosyltransferase family 1 protein [Leptospira idonii]
MKIVYLVSEDWYFWMHRLPIALEAKANGYEVHLISRRGDFTDKIVSYGIHFHEFSIDRKNLNPFKEIGKVKEVGKLLRKIQPDILHNVSMKLSLLGTVASYFYQKCKIVNSITGLGYLYSNSFFLVRLIRYFFSKFASFYFQRTNALSLLENPDDERVFLSSLGLHKDLVKVIPGTGVDLQKFPFTPLKQDSHLRILCASRLLKTKGIVELSEAIRESKKTNPNILCTLIGKIDAGNPSSLSSEFVKQCEEEGIWEWKGFTDDVLPYYQKAHLVVLLSYGEGLPVSLLEAMAVGRGVLTTDVQGCREVVEEGKNGFLVKDKNVEEPVSKLRYLADHLDELEVLGKHSRELAEKKFDRKLVNQTILSIYRN